MIQFLNFFLQFIFVRVIKAQRFVGKGKYEYYCLWLFVLPLTGWWSDYISTQKTFWIRLTSDKLVKTR